jgi:hypothetical protein
MSRKEGDGEMGEVGSIETHTPTLGLTFKLCLTSNLPTKDASFSLILLASTLPRQGKGCAIPSAHRSDQIGMGRGYIWIPQPGMSGIDLDWLAHTCSRTG